MILLFIVGVHGGAGGAHRGLPVERAAAGQGNRLLRRYGDQLLPGLQGHHHLHVSSPPLPGRRRVSGGVLLSMCCQINVEKRDTV